MVLTMKPLHLDEDTTSSESRSDEDVLSETRATPPRPQLSRGLGFRKQYEPKELCNELLSVLKDKLTEAQHQESEIWDMIETHMIKGKARFNNDNSRGALLSMRNVERLEREQASVLHCIWYLRNCKKELKEYLEKLKKADRRRRRASIDSSSSFDLSKFRRIDDELEKIVSLDVTGPRIQKARDDELLARLASARSA